MSIVRLLAAVCVGFVLAVASVQAQPEVFSDATFADDEARAQKDGKLHVICVNTAWSDPNKFLDETTWSDPWLAAWLNEKAIVSSFNSEKETDLARRFKIRAVPTVIVMRDGEELGRTLRLLNAEQMRSWIQDPSGELSGRPESSWTHPDELEKRVAAARQLLMDESYEDATEIYVDLWENMPDENPRMTEFRMDEVLSGIYWLADDDEDAAEKFRAIRDREGELMQSGNITFDRLQDWVTLNGVLYDESLTMAWVDREKDNPESLRAIRRLSVELEDQAYENMRWDIMTFLVPDPLKTIKDRMRPTVRRALSNSTEEPFEDIYAMLDFLRGPVSAALHMDDNGEAEKQLIEHLDEITGDSDAWRAAFIVTAIGCDKHSHVHGSWSKEYNLRERYSDQWYGDPPF